MATGRQIDIIIDKLTRSIENAISGDNFKTEVLLITINDIKSIKKTDWIFDWKKEAKNKDKFVYKLVVAENLSIIQGLISIQDKGDHIYMHLIESSKFNRGEKKVYLGFLETLLRLLASFLLKKVTKDFFLLKVKQN